jgi:hypothetical protein
MKISASTITIIAFLGAGTLDANVSATLGQPVPHAGEIPQSLRLEHEDTLQQLENLSRHRGAVGDEARKALVLFKKHLQREEAYILPPLTLLPLLADGKVLPDMKWAIDMASRVKAERDEIFQEHTQITDAMNALAAAAQKAHDAAALDFAHAAVADSLNDIELIEPMTIVIGDYLRTKLPATP